MALNYNTAQSSDIRAWAAQQSNAALQAAQTAQIQGNTALAQQMFAWQQKMDTAAQTGKWDGQWNNPQEQWFTGQFGQWYGPGGEPPVGTQTLGAQGQYFNQGMDITNAFGQYYAPGTAPAQGAQTEAQRVANLSNAATVADLTGYYNAPGSTGQGTQTLAGGEQQFTQGLRTQQEQRAAQSQQQSQTMGYLGLLASLRGPADWAKYQQVLGSTPGGMRDLAAAAAGQYVPGGGATTGMQPQAANLTTMMQQVAGQPVTWTGTGSVPQGQLYTPDVYGQNSQGMYAQQAGQGYPDQTAAQTAYYNQYAGQYGGQPQQGQANWDARAQQLQQYQQTMGAPNQSYGQASGTYDPNALQQQYQQAQGNLQQNYQRAQGNQQAWGSGIGVGQQQATPQQQQQGYGGGSNLPAPNQISAQSWGNMAPSQQQMLLGMYEDQGWDKNDVQALYNQSLPKYGSPGQGSTGTWKM